MYTTISPDALGIRGLALPEAIEDVDAPPRRATEDNYVGKEQT